MRNFGDAEASLRVSAEVEDIAKAEAILRICVRYRRYGRPLDAAFEASVPLVGRTTRFNHSSEGQPVGNDDRYRRTLSRIRRVGGEVALGAVALVTVTGLTSSFAAAAQLHLVCGASSARTLLQTRTARIYLGQKRTGPGRALATYGCLSGSKRALFLGYDRRSTRRYPDGVAGLDPAVLKLAGPFVVYERRVVYMRFPGSDAGGAIVVRSLRSGKRAYDSHGEQNREQPDRVVLDTRGAVGYIVGVRPSFSGGPDHRSFEVRRVNGAARVRLLDASDFIDPTFLRLTTHGNMLWRKAGVQYSASLN